MKNIVKIFLIVLTITILIITIVAIININLSKEEIDNNLKDELFNNGNQSNNSEFTAVVTNSNAKSIEVKPIKDKDLKLLSDKVVIGLGENNDMVYPVGSQLLITYTGDVMDTYPTQIHVTKIQTEIEYMKNIEDLPKDYTTEQAVTDNCIVSANANKIYNKDELDRFLENVNNNVPDFARFINYTVEGDTIITDVNFEGSNNFKVCLDSTRDKWSAESDKTYKNYRFTKLTTEDNEDSVSIYLQSPVDGQQIEIMLISYKKNAQIINDITKFQ